MGCCGSKEEHDEDDLNAPLLPHDETASGSHMNYQSTDTMDVKKEQDFWTQVIERTTRQVNITC
ncbi:hypothetical protein BDF14DRAFT_1721038 [Spinellus fusiger]|nr:hypothetical protein BDF14DRAFT_1721038 [Spinellus fusiger]